MRFLKKKTERKKEFHSVSELAEKMAGKFHYDYMIYRAGTDYDQIMNVYEERLAIGKKEGFFPVIVPVDSVLEDFWNIILEEGYSVEEALKAASSEDGKKYLEERYKEYAEDSEREEGELIGNYDGAPEKINGVSSFVKLGSNETEETIIFEVRTTNPWELVAYLPFGGWNECPEPDKMAAVCKYWFDKYGAVPVTISHDTLEMAVPECVPESAALELAKEHYAFTPDRVDQGTQTCTISEVAASLRVSKVWYFWWD